MRNKATSVDLALITLLAGVAVFYRLGELPIYLWDESRLANNAIEMLAGSGWLVTTFGGEPDLWNTKPPLQIWLMSGSMWLLGPSEYALRLPSALAAYATAIVVYSFAKSETGSRFAGMVAALVLLSTVGFVAPHVAKTGDYDSLLVLTTTLGALAFYRIVEEIRSSNCVPRQWLTLFVLATAAGVLVKGVAGLMLLPGFALYALARGAVPTILSRPASWVGLAALIGIPAAYYIAREWAGPGYLAAVQVNELGGRFFETIEGHDAGPRYYLDELIRPWRPGSSSNLFSAAPWSWFVPLAVVAGLFSPRHRAGTAFLGLVVIVYVAIISVAQTKLGWYLAPVYPLMSVLLALGGHAGVQRALAPTPPESRGPISGAVCATVVLVGLAVMAVVVQRNLREIAAAPRTDDLQSAAFLRDVAVNSVDGAIRILHDGYFPGGEYSPQEQFYAKRLRLSGVDAQVVPSDYPIRQGQRVVWCANHVVSAPSVSGTVLAEQGPCRLIKAGERA
jgi:4-amino-4-deoxy-L-arabinose transferase-like glycosyltransferase